MGDTVYLTDGGSFVLPVDPDLDSTNEIQFLSRMGDTVYSHRRRFFCAARGPRFGFHE